MLLTKQHQPGIITGINLDFDLITGNGVLLGNLNLYRVIENGYWPDKVITATCQRICQLVKMLVFLTVSAGYFSD